MTFPDRLLPFFLPAVLQALFEKKKNLQYVFVYVIIRI